jgi:hypothetical protein
MYLRMNKYRYLRLAYFSLFAGVVLGVEPFRNDQGQQASNSFLGRVAEDMLGGGVPTHDLPIGVGGDDGVVRRLDDCAEGLVGVHP